MNGEPQNIRSARWHRTRRGFEWQYWNWRVARWSRYTREQLSPDEARERVAKFVYGCEIDDVAIIGRATHEVRQ